MTSRLKRLQRQLAETKIDALIVSDSANRRYLSGFTGSSGQLFISHCADHKPVLATDFRYIEQAQTQAPDFEIIKTTGGLIEWLPPLFLRFGWRRIGLESQTVTMATYEEWVKATRKIVPTLRPKLIATAGIAESIRAVKEPDEIEAIRQAIAISDAAVNHAAHILNTQMTEKELAWKLERFMREQGSETLPFDIIVASGPNAALPHAQPSDKEIMPGEPVVIDLGAKSNGYTSDITRTICLGEPSDKFREVYHIVQQSQTAALNGTRAGMRGDAADALARAVIDKAGYGDAFGHGLGHGVGIETHELPRLGIHADDVLHKGMVFTVEPGIYLEGWGGVRIEDMVSLEASGPCVLTQAGKLEF